MSSAKKVLVVASNYGFWGEELQAPWDALVEAGHDLTIATPQGKKPLPLTISVDPDFVDPIQDYHVNPPEVCDRVKELVNSGVWDNPVKVSDVNFDDYDAVVLAGGLGADLDLLNNTKLKQIVLDAYRSDKLIGAMCFAVGTLVNTRIPENGHKSVVYGKNITAHPREWDFRGDVSYDLWNETEDNKGTDVITPGFVVPLHDLAEDAVGPEGSVFADPGISREEPSAILDWPIVTATSVESSIEYGKRLVEALDLMGN
jgi:putative intracellular protease/amidase